MADPEEIKAIRQDKNNHSPLPYVMLLECWWLLGVPGQADAHVARRTVSYHATKRYNITI